MMTAKFLVKKQWLVMTLCFGIILQAGCNDSDSKPAGKRDEKPNPPVVNSDATRNQGQWKATSATLAGNSFPQAITESITLSLTGNQYTVMVGDKPDKGICVIDLEHSPRRMTITGTEGPNIGKTFLAVFDFPADNEMRVCYDLTGKQFPGGFESAADNGWYLVHYSRSE